jgi:hypothetical protein
MAMRVCVFCKQDVTYERENRNILKGGAVGFWTNPITGQATCPDAPVDPKTGQQLHSVGDVHTPPVHDPEQLEAFLNGTYVPPAPSKPCGQMYGLSDEGEFLECGLDAGHDGACAPGTPVQASVQDSADPGPEMVMMDVSYGTETLPNGSPKVVTITAQIDGVSIALMFDKEKVGPTEVMQMLGGFTEAARRAVLTELLGPDAVAAMDAVQEAAQAAAKPEVPKILEDPEDIEKFLNGDD